MDHQTKLILKQIEKETKVSQRELAQAITPVNSQLEINRELARRARVMILALKARTV